MVARRTSNNYTYNMGSHVLQFGALAIDEEPVADYLGELNTGARSTGLPISAAGHPLLMPCWAVAYLHVRMGTAPACCQYL